MEQFNARDRDAIRDVLRTAKVTHDQVAIACHVARTTISLWLAGQVDSPALDKAIPAFASALTAAAK